jgi:hypothetical protein
MTLHWNALPPLWRSPEMDDVAVDLSDAVRQVRSSSC